MVARWPAAVNQTKSDAEAWNSSMSGRICPYPASGCLPVFPRDIHTCKWYGSGRPYVYQNILGRLLAPAGPPTFDIKIYGLLHEVRFKIQHEHRNIIVSRSLNLCWRYYGVELSKNQDLIEPVMRLVFWLQIFRPRRGISFEVVHAIWFSSKATVAACKGPPIVAVLAF